MKIIIAIIMFVGGLLTSFSQGIVNNGGHIVNSGQIKIVIDGNGNWTDNGTFTSGNGSVILTGNSNQKIQGSSNTSFYNLTVNKSSGDALLLTDIYVTNNLTITNGDLDIQNSNIDLQSTGSIEDETEAHRIKVGDPLSNTGTIKYTRTINNVTSYDPANLGVKITTNKNLGNITVTRGHKRAQGTGTFTSNYGIARYYEIPNIGELDGNNVNIEMHYWDAELGTEHPDETNLKLYQYLTQSTDNYWTELAVNLETNSNSIIPKQTDTYDSYVYGSAHGQITFNSRFTIGSSDTPLPIQLLSFNAKKTNNYVNLEWETFTEINNDYFIVQKSKDTKNWEYVSQIKGAGNSNTILNYNSVDFNPYQGTSYYRLKQVDFDGRYTFSKMKQIYINKFNNIEAKVYPNPCCGLLNIECDIENNSILNIYNTNGALIITQVLNKETKLNTIDLSHLEKGNYLIKINNKLINKIILK